MNVEQVEHSEQIQTPSATQGKNKKRVLVGCYLTIEEYDVVDRMAKEKKISRSKLITQIIRDSWLFK